jgi:hypothetical protein
MARSRSARARSLLVGLLAALAVLVLAGAARVERRDVALADGTICGSVWHNRPGAGYVVGGELSPQQREEARQACLAAAGTAAYNRGLRLAGLGVGLLTVALVAALVISVKTIRARSRDPDLLP